MNKFLVYTSNLPFMPKNMEEVINFAKENCKFRIAQVELNGTLANVKAGDNIITKKGNSIYVIKAITESLDNLSEETQEYLNTLAREYGMKKVGITSVDTIVKFETWCKTAKPIINAKNNNKMTKTNSIKGISARIKEMFMPVEATDVRIATDGNIALERSYAKVTKISDGKITAISYTGSGKTIHTIKDFLFNQTMVRVVVSLAGNVGGQINPMLLLALSNKDDKDALLPLLMMNQNGGALGMNPMMLMMLTDKGEGTSMKDMLLLSAMSGGNMFGGMFGQVPQPAKVKEAPAVEPQPEIED